MNGHVDCCGSSSCPGAESWLGLTIGALLCFAGCQHEVNKVQLQTKYHKRVPITAVEFSHNGGLLAAGSGEPAGGGFTSDAGQTWVWNLTKGGKPVVIESVRWVCALAFSRDSGRLFIGSGRWSDSDGPSARPTRRVPGPGLIRIWDIGKNEQSARVMSGGPVISMAASPDAKTLASIVFRGDEQTVLQLRDADTLEEENEVELGGVAEDPNPNGQFRLVAFSQDGSRLVAAVNSNWKKPAEVIVWEFPGMKKIWSGGVDNGPIRTVRFLDDEGLLTATTGDRAFVWNIEKGEVVPSTEKFFGRLYSSVPNQGYVSIAPTWGNSQQRVAVYRAGGDRIGLYTERSGMRTLSLAVDWPRRRIAVGDYDGGVHLLKLRLD